MFIGVDVHLTHLTSVLVDGRGVRAAVRVARAGELGSDLGRAVAAVLRVEPVADQVRSVTIARSTPETELVNPGRLRRTACLRISPMDAETAPPMMGWPAQLRAAVGDHVFWCRGGNDFDGRVSRPLDVGGLERIANEVRNHELDAVAIIAAFAPVNAETELAAADFLAARLPGVRICLSHEIGSLGWFERENATIANASLQSSAESGVASILTEIGALLPQTPIYYARNDGTVMELAMARRYPVLTLWSGLAAAINGAAVLSGHDDCVVVDVRDDIALIGRATRAYPRLGRHDVSVVGIPMNLHHPELVSVRPVSGSGFGVADVEELERAVRRADQRRRLPVVLVGPAADSVPHSFEALRPEHAWAAGAIGASRSPIGAEVDCIVAGDAQARSTARQAAEELALHRVLVAGALDGSARIQDVEEIPLAYLPGDVLRLRVKAIGARG